jgi:RNA polymerase sporulation-specific sigma factor
MKYATKPTNELESKIHDFQSGNDDSFVFIFKMYSGLVKTIAKSYFLIGAEYDDLLQEGFIGLYKAVRDYQFKQNVPFRCFAELCIRRQIITAVKTTTRQKHKPLNTYTSINQNISNNPNAHCYGDYIPSKQPNPEEITIGKEAIEEIYIKFKEQLSQMEINVFELYSQGFSYQEIAQKLKYDYKRVDNAVWRIKKKLKKLK